MLPTKFRFNWLSSFREEDFQKSTNLKQELPVAAILANESGRNEQSLQRTFHNCFLPSFGSFGKVVSEEKIFQKSTNQKQEWPVAVMFVNGSELNEQSLQRTFQGCFLPSFDPFGQINRQHSSYCFLASELSFLVCCCFTCLNVFSSLLLYLSERFQFVVALLV